MAATARGIWYFFVGAGGTVRTEISNATFNAKLIIFSGPCNNSTCVDYSDGTGNTTVVAFPTTIGVTYYILVTGSSENDVGTFVLNVSGDISGPTISPTITPVFFPPTKVPVPISNPTPSAPVVVPTRPPSGFFRRLFRRLFGWLLN